MNRMQLNESANRAQAATIRQQAARIAALESALRVIVAYNGNRPPDRAYDDYARGANYAAAYCAEIATEALK